MKAIYSSEKPELKTSPDHYFGLPNVVAFSYKSGNLLYADKDKNKTTLFLNGKAIANIAEVLSKRVTHSNMMKHYNDAMKSNEDKANWIRGRTNSARTQINLWGQPDSNVIEAILRALGKNDVLNKQDEYKVGTISKTGGSNIYEVEPAKAPEVQIKPHKEIRKRLYKKLGLESKIKKFIKILRESL